MGVKIFKLYLKEKLYDPNFHLYSKSQLADLLEQFYVEIRKETERIQTGSFINIRAAIIGILGAMDTMLTFPMSQSSPKLT